MKIPFDITKRPQIESGEYKVVNRIGEKVHIIYWDGPDEDYPIVAFDGKDRMPFTWGKDGRFMTWRESDRDLFILTPEEKNNCPKLSDSLEKSAQEYEFSCYQRACFHPEHKWPSTTKDAFIAGAQWQRGQGQTKEGEVIEDGEFIKFSDGTYIDLCPGLGENSFDFKTGDKVIVQIHNK